MIRIIILFILSYIIFLLLFAPADKVYNFIQHDNIEIYSLEGNIWQAKAQGNIKELKIGEASLKNIQLQDTDLKINPLGFIQGNIHLTLDTKLLQGQAKTIINYSLINHKIQSLEQTHIILPAQFLEQLLGFQFQGRLALDLEKANFSNYKIKGELTWQRAELILGQPYPLGDWKITFTPTQNGSTATLLAKEGILKAKGEMIIENKKLNLNLSLQAVQEAPGIIRSTLRKLGKVERDGSVNIVLEKEL